MKNLSKIIIIIIGLTNQLFAYPISPRPLRQLVIESEYIIVGYVASTYKIKAKEEYDYGYTVAKIAILENLQGQIGKDTIEIQFNPNMICPSPARYFDSTFVISFINKGKDGKFYTQALSYGAKTLNKNEIEIYKNRIYEIQEILKICDPEMKLLEIIEWLVKCSEVETTRWEGTYELSPESDFMSYYANEKTPNIKSFLTVSQKNRLLLALTLSKELVDFGLVDLVYMGNERIVDSILIKELKSLNKDNYWFANEYMSRLLKSNFKPGMKEILESFENIQFSNSRENEQKELIDKFIKLLKN